MSTLLTTLCVILICAQAKAHSQPEFFQTTTPGATFHVNCRKFSGHRTLVWYKLDTSNKLHMLTSINTKEGQNIYQERRFSVQSSEKDNTLSVRNVTLEDTGIYFCGVINEHDVDFGQGTEVVVKEKSKPASLQTVVQSPDYISVQPGDSVTLRCSFNTSNCPQDHIGVTWKRNSSASDIISQIYGTKKIHCESRSNTGEASCVHNLTMSVSSADNGTFFCVVFACGNTLSGSGTKIQLYNIDDCINDSSDVSPTVIGLTVSNIVFGVSLLVLLWVVFSILRKQDDDDGSKQDMFVVASDANKGNQSGVAKSESSTVRENDCSYSSVCDPGLGSGHSKTLVWYKLDSSRNLQRVASANTKNGEDICFSDRCSVRSTESGSTLNVSKVYLKDAGTYYCGVMLDDYVRFASGTEVVVEGKSKSVIQSPDYISVQPGDSVTLKCSFTISHCSQDHISVTWKKNTSAPEFIPWSYKTKKIYCEYANPGETSCVHNLTMTVSSTDDGTYLCVVFACGLTLSGSGSKIHLDDVIDRNPTVISLIVLNIVFGVSVLVLVMFSNHRKQDSVVGVGSKKDIQLDTLTFSAESLAASSRSATMKRRQNPDIYTQVCLHFQRLFKRQPIRKNFVYAVVQSDVSDLDLKSCFLPSTDHTFLEKMTTFLSVLCVLLVWAQAKSQFQPEITQTTALGASLQLNCQIYRDSRTLVWYKLDSSRKLQLIYSENTQDGYRFYQHVRFSVQSSERGSTLSIFDVILEDAGTYFCGIMNKYYVSFEPGIEVVVVEEKSKPSASLLQTVVQSPDYISVQPGDSVTLKCSFDTSNCPQDQTNVTWKRNNSALEIISWSNSINNINCESRSNSGEASCVHNLTMTVSSADEGTYLCVVTACGNTLSGSGTRIYFNTWTTAQNSCVPNTMALIGSNIVVGLVVLVLLWGIWRSSNKTERESCGRKSSINNQDDTLTCGAEGSLVTSYRLTAMKRRRDPDIYSKSVGAEFQSGLIQVRLGEPLRVKCEVDKGWTTLNWYKQDTNRELQQIEDKRFSVNLSDTGSILSVSAARLEDAGRYYCKISSSTFEKFISETNVLVTEESRPTQSVSQSPNSVSVQPADCSLCLKENSSITPFSVMDESANLSPSVIVLIGSNIVVGLVVFVLLWEIWRTSNKTEVDSCGHRSSCNNQSDDTLTYTAGSLVTSSKSATMKRRRNPDIYSQVCYCHCGK
ncbi:hypothetical protein WMY93_017260 [Mugilogobius chulae]|uniref:Ig-like domain-containing protein n=1 Tax=Mugilogobius chulae TaxID=88201 RepID=A0AAW0NQF2_9GOBI